MNLVQGFLLGLIQGLTEFLPVSSSGHLVIAQKLLGFSQPPVTFDVLVHLATAAAVVIFLWPVIKSLKLDTLVAVVIGTLPAVVVGLLLNSRLDVLFNSLPLVGGSLLIPSLLLFAAISRYPKARSIQLTSKTAFLIGLFQALAILPGISRSGSTIAAAIILGVKPSLAFTFSFLLALPAILGAQMIQLPQLTASSIPVSILITGFVTALVSGFFALKLLRTVVISKNLSPFAYYCLTLGLIVLLFL